MDCVHEWEVVFRFDGRARWWGAPSNNQPSQLPDGGQQMAEHGVVGAGKPPARSSSATCRSRMPDGDPQSAEDGVVEAGKLQYLLGPYKDELSGPFISTVTTE